MEVQSYQFRRGNLKFNQDDNGMMKNKHPGFITEHIYRAVRSEGPVNITTFSSEAQSDWFSLQPLTLISGIPENKKKFRLPSKPKRRKLRMKRTIKLHKTLFGTTDLTLPLDLSVQFKTSWPSLLLKEHSTKPSSTLDTPEQWAFMRIITKVLMELHQMRTKKCCSTTKNLLNTRATIDYW